MAKPKKIRKPTPGMALTDAEYVAQEKAGCPFCGSEDIEWGDISIEGEEAIKEATCNGCGKAWNEVYKLTGYERKD